MHGGSVRAASAGPNVGTTLTFALPRLVAGDGESLPGRRETPFGELGRLPDLRDLRILLVDDEPDGRTMVGQILQACGAEVAAAGSADEALRVLESFKPDVLLSDIQLPVKSGYQLLQEIRSLDGSASRNVPAIALTGLARAEDRRRALMAGFQFHIAKPFDAGELIAAVAMLCGRTGG